MRIIPTAHTIQPKVRFMHLQLLMHYYCITKICANEPIKANYSRIIYTEQLIDLLIKYFREKKPAQCYDNIKVNDERLLFTQRLPSTI